MRRPRPVLLRLLVPLAFGAALSSVASGTEPHLVDAVDRSIEFSTEDGIEIHGILSYPADAFKEQRPVPLVVLFHGFGLTIDSVTALSDALVERGFAAARFDLRGHGRSRVRDGTSLYVFPVVPYEEFTRSVDDARALIADLRKRDGIDGSRIVLAGVAEGALIAAEVAALDPGILATVLVDASATALGFDPETALGIVGTRPVLLVASSQPLSQARAEALAEFGLGERTIVRLESFEARHRLVGPGSEGASEIGAWLRAKVDSGSN